MTNFGIPIALICDSSEKDNNLLEMILLNSHLGNTNEAVTFWHAIIKYTREEISNFQEYYCVIYFWDITQIIQLTFKVILKYHCGVLVGKLSPSFKPQIWFSSY